MKSAAEEYGPGTAQRVENKLNLNLKDLQSLRDIGQQLQQSGVTQDPKQANLTLVKNDQGSQSAHKDMGVQQGERPALSPCDGKVQANSKTDIKPSAAQEFGPPAQTPNVPPPPSQGRSR